MAAMKFRFVLLFLLLTIVETMLPACGPWFPETIAGNESKILTFERTEFSEEIRQIFKDTAFKQPWETNHWQNTLDADLAGLAEALGPNASSMVLNQYKNMRTQMKSITDGQDNISIQERAKPGISRRYSYTAADMELIKQLPVEFALYLEGASHYRSADFSAAIEELEKILTLPQDERRHRSVWAAFMIGKSWLFSDPAQSIPYFERTRQLAAEGCFDPLNLSAVSFGWQAFAQRKLGRTADALQSYIAQAGRMPLDEILVSSMRTACGDMVRAGVIEPAAMADPMSRKVLAAFATSRRSAYSPVAHGKIIADAFTTATMEMEPEIADRFARAAYSSGKMDEARRWLTLAKTHTPLGRWVQAKLLLYDGEIDDGLKILNALAREFPLDDPDAAITVNPSVHAGFQRDRAVLLLGRAEFVDAFDAMVHAGSWEDIAYIAERVLTMRELSTYLREHAGDSAQKATLDDLHYLLARRLARAHLWSQARDHYPDDMKAEFDAYRELLRSGLDGSKPRRERAENLFKAAWVMRYRGMELFGTELNPDWTVYRGDHDQGIYVERRKKTLDLQGDAPVMRAVRVTRDELDRVDLHSVLFEKRWHYRFRASELMWQVAQLTPDNDPLTAAALFWGGNWHRNRAEEDAYADRFYQQLVRRCSKLPIGIEADKLRWFPTTPPPIPIEVPKVDNRAAGRL